MITSDRSTVVGVFKNRDQADRAIDELRRAGISYNHIRLAERGTGSFLDTLKSLFTGSVELQETTANTPDDLMKMGMPEQDAGYYQSQLEANHAIVIVKDVASLEQCLSILRQSGAYDINLRLRTADQAMPQGAPGGRQETADQTAPVGAGSPGSRRGTVDQAMPQGAPGSRRGTVDQAMPQGAPGGRQGTADQTNAPDNPNIRPGTYNPSH